jgi:ATP-binding cassette subfamily F protein 3
VVADHAVANFDGDLDDYQRMVLATRSTRAEPADRGQAKPEQARRGDNAKDNGRGDSRGSLKQKISAAEAEIARISDIIAKIDTALALPDLFTRDPKQAAQLSKARANAADALQRAEEEWLAASAQFEEI